MGANMTALRVLHVDDEPDIRELVEMSLGLDPAFALRSCASSRDALAIVSDWSPHLILIDVMMPDMDGPTMLAHLRERQETAQIPVVFVTARTQTKELEQFKALGATGVIAKPFDPVTLPESVRSHLRAAGTKALGHGFIRRLRSDAQALAACRISLQEDRDPTAVLSQIQSFAHALAGVAGIFGYHKVTRDARQLEEAVIGVLNGSARQAQVEVALDQLLLVMQQS
jgi:CheY-like chemotaxis protein